MFYEVCIAAVPHSFRKLIITSWLIRTNKLFFFFFTVSLKFILMCNSIHVIVEAYGSAKLQSILCN